MNRDVPAPEDVLRFWFEATPHDRHFVADPAFDAEIRARFGALVDDALAGRVDGWAETANGALALVIVLDQFTRNLGRGTPAAFAGDAKALAVCHAALARGFERALPPFKAHFLVMPLMHSEELADQDRCVGLMAGLGLENPYAFALRHREIIARFGRFPHRNRTLGRTTTAEEARFLQEPNSSF